MSKKSTSPAASSKNSEFSAESIREWSLKILKDTVQSLLDISQCGNAEYLRSLSESQSNKIKRVVYGNNGNIVSVEPVSVVDLVMAAANIAGTKELAKKDLEEQKEKAKAAAAAAREKAKEMEKSGSKFKSNKLELSVKAPEKSAPPAKEHPQKDLPEKNKKPTLSELIAAAKSGKC